jgi:hypothetical protein
VSWELSSALVRTTYPMLSSSGKRRASSPLGSERGKTPRLGLTQDEVSTFNENLRDLFQLFPLTVDASKSTSVLAVTMVQVASHLLCTARASIVDMSWMTDFESCLERIDLLSPEVRQDLVSVWVEAREKGDWERFASHCALRPSDRYSATYQHNSVQSYFSSKLPL